MDSTKDLRMNSSERFSNHFQIPKLNQIKIKNPIQESDLKDLKNFSDFDFEIFEFFEEISGKKVNRELVKAHLHHYYDEGFEPSEIKNYIRSQISTDYYRVNPQFFTIARLFPIKDPDRINMVWDLISYELSKLQTGEKKKEKAEDILHSKIAFRIDPLEITCLANPYDMISKVEDNELRELCYFFMRLNDESLLDYMRRTEQRRKEIYIRNGIKAGNPSNLLSFLDEEPTKIMEARRDDYMKEKY